MAAISVFLLQGFVQTTAPRPAFADPGERWVKLTIVKHPDAAAGKRTAVFFYPESEYESYKDGAYRQTKLYLKSDRQSAAQSWLAKGPKKFNGREYVSWQPEKGDKIQDSAAEAPDFTRETLVVAAPKAEPGKVPGKEDAGGPQGGAAGEWVKVSHGGKDYYHPKDAKPRRNGAGKQQIDLFDSPGGKKVPSHLFGSKAEGPYTLHVVEGGKPVNVPEGSYKREIVALPPDPGGPVVVAPKPEPGQAPTVSGTAAAPDDNHPVNRVAKALLPLDGKEGDLADRFLKYVWREPWSGGKSFVHPERRKVDDGKPLLGPIAEWVKKNPDQAAVLYYGLGSGQPAPGWVLQDDNLRKLLADKPRSDPKLEAFEDSLAECLGRWTTSPGGEPPKHCKNAPAEETEFAIGPLGGGANLLKWVKAYLKDAATESNAIFYALNISSKELEGRIGSAPPTEGLPTAGPPGDRRLPTGIDVTKPFGVADLFGTWGDPNVLYIDGRFLALVVRTVRTKDNPPEYKQMVGLYDITSPDNIYGKRFDLDYPGGEAFKLDDKRPDARQYILDFKPIEGKNDMEISIKRPDDTGPTDGNGGPGRIPTLNELFVNRAVKARSYGHQVKMGDKTFYVSGESADRGSLLFWSEETIQRAIDPNVNPRDLKPEMLAYVNKKSAGEVVNLGDRVSVGPAGGEDPAKAWHWLKWNASLRIWQPELGEAPKVETKPPSGTPGQPGSPDNKPPAPGPTNPTDGKPPTGGDRVLPDGWPDLENYNTTDGRAGALNKALSEDLKPRLKFYENKTGAVPGQQIIMMHGKSRLRMSYVIYINSGQDGRVTGKTLGEEVLAGRVLMTDSDKGAVYFDLDAVAKKMDAISEPVALPEWNAGDGNLGKYLPEGGANAVDNVKDMAVLTHVLPKAGYPAEAAAAIGERSAKLLSKAKPGSHYSFSGKKYDASSKGRIAMGYETEVGEACAVLWPVLNEETCESPGNDEGTTGIAFDPAKGMLNPFEGFGKPPKLDGVTAVEVVKVDGEAALYRSDAVDEKDEKKKTQKWYLVYVVKTVKTDPKDDKAVVTVGKYRTNYIQVFQTPATRSFRTFPGKDALGIRGVTYDEAKLPHGQFPQGNAFYNEIPKPYRGDSTLNKGAVAVHDAPNGEMRSKDPKNNCVGVVLWWKVTAEDALKACRTK
ncbi:MAG: hypothetical protein AAB412_00305 [Elusimicrobiota bacterium]